MKADLNSILAVARQICAIAAIVGACALLAKGLGVQISFVRMGGTELAATVIALALAGGR